VAGPPSRSPPPEDEPAAEAHAASGDFREARCAPRVEQTRLRPLLPEVADARAEEVSHLPPARRDDGSRGRQSHSHVELPERPPCAARQAELEHRDRSAGADDPRQLAQRRRYVVDVAEEIREGERVELGVGEGQGFGPSVAELDPFAQTGACDLVAPGRKHLGALVDADHRPRGPSPSEPDRDGRGSRGDVEHTERVGRNARDEERSPARVLAEGEQARVTVVRLAERGEQLTRVARAGRGFHSPILAA
jgi:hypothetical protein